MPAPLVPGQTGDVDAMQDAYRRLLVKCILDSEPTGNWLTLVRKLGTTFGLDLTAVLPVTTLDHPHKEPHDD